MFQTIASLLLFGALSPLGGSSVEGMQAPSLEVTPPSIDARLRVSDTFSASGAIAMDVFTGKELFALDADEPRPMGSLAKLMTAIIILEHHNLSDLVTIPRGVHEVAGNVAGLTPGDRYTVRDLLSAMLIASANDAAYALAIEHSDSMALFADEMNKRARSLGLTKTFFTNPIGFDSPTQVSTPRELAWLSMYALKQDFIRTQAARTSTTIVDQSAERSMTLYSTNKLLSSHPGDFFGLKTGTTEGAGQCLISLAYAHGRPYLFVILKSSDRYQDALDLFASLAREKT